MTTSDTEPGFTTAVVWCRDYDTATDEEQTGHMAAGHRILWNDADLHRRLHALGPGAVPHLHLPGGAS